MSTSGNGDDLSGAGAWRLELNTFLYSNVESLAAAIDGLYEMVDERRDDCLVRLWFDSAEHHQRAGEILGLIASAGTNSQEVEAQEIIRLQAQVERLLKLVKAKLRSAKKKGRKNLSSLRQALFNPLNNLRKKLRILLLAARKPASPMPTANELPDFHTTWQARQKTKAKLQALYGEWNLLRLTIPQAKPVSAWHRALDQLWGLPTAMKAPHAKRSRMKQSAEIHSVSMCFVSPLSEEVEELSHTVDVFTFLGGRVLGLCRTLAESNTRPESLVQTGRWRELLEICRELHFNSGCLRFKLLSPFARGDPRDDGGQELIESTRAALKRFLDQAFGISPDHRGALIRWPMQNEAPPAPDQNERKIPDKSIHVSNSPTPLNKGGVPSASKTVGGETNEGAVQTSNKTPPVLTSGEGPEEKSDPQASTQASQAASTDALVPGNVRVEPKAASLMVTEAQAALQPAKDISPVIRMKIAKDPKKGFQVFHDTGFDLSDMTTKSSVADSMLAFLVLHPECAGSSGSTVPLKIGYEKYFELCFPVIPEGETFAFIRKRVKNRIRDLRKYLTGIEIEDDGVTFSLKNLALVPTFNVNSADVGTFLRTRSGRMNPAG